MHIIENIIPKRWQEDLLKYVQHLPFTYSQNTSYQQYINGEPSSFISGYDYLIDENTVDTPQFVHTSIFTGVHSPDTSISYSEFRPLLYMMQENLNKRITAVSRVKVNCLLQNQNMKNHNYNTAHVDNSFVDGNTHSAIYYANDSDGDTFFFNEFCEKDKLVEKLTIKDRVTPEMGKMVIFPARQFHASSNPVNTISRFVINFMFEVE